MFKAHRLLYHSTLGLNVIKNATGTVHTAHLLLYDDPGLASLWAIVRVHISAVCRADLAGFIGSSSRVSVAVTGLSAQTHTSPADRTHTASHTPQWLQRHPEAGSFHRPRVGDRDALYKTFHRDALYKTSVGEHRASVADTGEMAPTRRGPSAEAFSSCPELVALERPGVGDAGGGGAGAGGGGSGGVGGGGVGVEGVVSVGLVFSPQAVSGVMVMVRGLWLWLGG